MEIHWQAYEHEYNKKSSDWFWALWIISVATIFISIMFRSNLFAILVFVGAFTLSLQAVKKPKLIKFKISNSKITNDDKVFYYKEISSYNIKSKEKKIILKLKNKLMPLITIPLAKKEDAQKIDDFLSKYLEKENLKEPLTNKLVKYF